MRAQLRQHRRHQPHGMILFTSFVMTSICPWCSTVLPPRGVAIGHVRAAFRLGHCVIDRGIVPQPPPDELEVQCH